MRASSRLEEALTSVQGRRPRQPHLEWMLELRPRNKEPTMLEVRVCVDVDDLEKGIAFYTRAFDLRVGRRLDRSWVELLGARSPIDLLAEPAGSKAAPTAEPH